jgi:DNA-binding GntR family transcriptional regulator
VPPRRPYGSLVPDPSGWLLARAPTDFVSQETELCSDCGSLPRHKPSLAVLYGILLAATECWIESRPMCPTALPRVVFSSGQSLARELYEHLRTAIINGSLRPNERLVESQLASSYSVSRTPVREALHRLAVDGLVEETGRGATVRAISAKELADISAVRESLEAMAAGLAATYRSETEMLTLHRILGHLREATGEGDPARLTELSEILHQTIARASRNEYLADQLLHLQRLIHLRQESSLGQASRQVEALSEHEGIVDALERQDSDAARSLTRRHFQQVTAVRLAMQRLDFAPADRQGP